jgi:uncharacterized membrane protein
MAAPHLPRQICGGVFFVRRALSWAASDAPLAYVSGSLGVLIGADLFNLEKIRGLGAPVASIGGAGTFDGVFLTGIIAVLFVSLGSGKPKTNVPGPWDR